MGRTYFQSIRDMDSLADLLAGMGETELSSLGGADALEMQEEPQEPVKRMRAAVKELSLKYEYRRAFSEISLLDALSAPGFNFQEGHSYNFITAGDIDSLSFLKAVLRQQPLNYLLLSTWCMAAEDVYQLRLWIESGDIERLDVYVGEIFKSSYSGPFLMLKEMYETHPGLGRMAIFRNHSKIYAGTGPLFSFGIQSSANINTNPRTEQTCITIDKVLFEFYKDYFDGINSFE